MWFSLHLESFSWRRRGRCPRTYRGVRGSNRPQKSRLSGACSREERPGRGGAREKWAWTAAQAWLPGGGRPPSPRPARPRTTAISCLRVHPRGARASACRTRNCYSRVQKPLTSPIAHPSHFLCAAHMLTHAHTRVRTGTHAPTTQCRRTPNQSEKISICAALTKKQP